MPTSIIESVWGIRIAPESVALTPIAPWAYTGMYTIAPNIATEIRNEAAMDRATTGSRSIDSGTRGDSTFSSISTNATSSTIEAANMPRITGEVQA